MAGRIDGIALGAIATGAVLAYAGFKGKSVPSLLQGFIQGKSPAAAAAANTITPGTNSAPNGPSNPTGQIVASGSAQAILQKTAAQFGWGSGSQWQALQSVEMAEAGFDPQATNPQSGAFGLAQALGHGNANTACPATGVNEYGGFGLSDAQAQQANCGQAGPQALWMCNYIQATYGSPQNAWAHEQANGWY